MPDITMCKGVYCPMRERCHRYTATPSKHRQAYFTESPFVALWVGKDQLTHKIECAHFWPNDEVRK